MFAKIDIGDWGAPLLPLWITSFCDRERQRKNPRPHSTVGGGPPYGTGSATSKTPSLRRRLLGRRGN